MRPEAIGGRGGGMGSAGSADGIRNPLTADQESIVAGQAIYQKECLPCHGNMGKGNGPPAIFLEPRSAGLSMPMMREHSDGALFWKITKGRRPMPSFEKRLTGKERWQVVNYIRTLAAHPEGSAGKKEPKDTVPMGNMN